MKNVKKSLGARKGRNSAGSSLNVPWLQQNAFRLTGGGIIIILGLIIYSNSFTCSFHFDDLFHIVTNKKIRDLWDIKSWWSHSPNRPIPIFTFVLNYHFHKLDVFYYHLVNLVIHLITSCIIYWITSLIFSSPYLKNHKLTIHKEKIALFTALLFVAHPLATQSVTYIIQRMTSMAAMFYLFSIALYIKARLTDTKRLIKIFLFSGVILSGIFAMFTKENAFTLPFAILLTELFFLRSEKFKINFRDYRVILISVAILAVGLIIPMKQSVHIFDPITPTLGHTYTLTPYNYLLTQFSVIVKYLQLILFPINQHLDYYFPISNSFFEVRTLLSFLFLAGLFVSAVLLFKKSRIYSFGIFWFFLTLSIESSFIPITDVIFEHRTYLPSFGIFLIIASTLWGPLLHRFRFGAYAALIIIIATLSYLTYERNKVWKDDITLWTDNIEKAPGYARPINNRGYAYIENGQFEKAIEDCSKAIEFYPEFATAYTNRGVAYSNLSQFDNALKDYTRSIELDSTNDQVFYHRGLIYANLKQYEKAIADYTKSIELNPGYNQAYYDRGIVYGTLDEFERAISDYTKTIEVNPGFIHSYNNRGTIYRKLGRLDLAIADYSSAIKIDPDYFKSYYNRGNAYAIQKDWENAISDFTKVIEINPSYSEAYSNRAVAYGNLSQWPKSVADYSQLIKLNPNDINAYINRGIAFGNLGLWSKAVDDFNNVLTLQPGNTTAAAYRDIAMKNL